MALSKSKKRKKRKIEKRKNLKIMNPEFIKANQCWLPEDIKDTFTRPTNSWFNITSNRKKKPIDKRLRYEPYITTENLRVKRIEIFPTKDQKAKLLDWMETYRQLYNLTITHRSKFMKKGYMASYMSVMRPTIKNEILPNCKSLLERINRNELPSNIRRQSTIPAHSIWNAVNDVKKAFDSALANKQAGNIKSFRLRHKKASNPIRTFVIEPGTFSKTCNAFAVTSLGIMESSELFGEVEHECRLAYSSLTGKFVLWKPYTKITTVKEYKSDIIALDPGMRTFQNGYSPNGICYKFASTSEIKTKKSNTNKANNKILKGDKIKYLLHKIEDVKKIPGRNYKKYLKRIRNKLTNMITDLHWKTASFLCKNFRTILIGNMSTTGIVKKEKSVLRAFDKKFCIQLSHYKFRERLLSKAKEHYVKCLVVDESYTTQTCGKCGTRNLKVGGNKKFNCIDEICSFKYDRDYNAGRNIYLKALSNGLI